MSLPYCNNLQKNDEVHVVSLNRRGLVHMQPRETSVNVSVLLDGVKTPRYFAITDLRLVINGAPEEVAPMDGEPPAAPEKSIQSEEVRLEALLAERRQYRAKIDVLEYSIIELLAARVARKRAGA